MATYLQDDWRVRPNLTLNSARYEFAPPVDANDGMSTVTSTMKIVQVGTNGVAIGDAPDRNNLAPPGFSWSVAEHTWCAAATACSTTRLDGEHVAYLTRRSSTCRFVPGAQLLSLANPFLQSAGFAPPATLSAEPGSRGRIPAALNIAVERDVPSVGGCRWPTPPRRATSHPPRG